MIVESLLQASAANLTGPPHQGKQGSGYVRHGTQDGAVYLGGSKLKVRRPRVRKAGSEASIPAYETLRSDEDACRKVHRAALAGVSSRLVRQTAQDLEGFLERPIPQGILAVLIDGFHVGDACLIAAIGVDERGNKHALGLAEGTTENAAVAGDLLTSLVSRGLDPSQRLLFVLDGGKALKKAVLDVFGSHHQVQRCQVHKLRNVTDRVPAGKQTYVRAAMRAAWKLRPQEGIPRMRQLARELQVSHRDAAASILEGLEDCFTVSRLGLSPVLISSLSSTNLIENAHGAIRTAIRRLKRTDSPGQAMRWCASALLEAEQNMRTLKGHKELWMLAAALQRTPQQKIV
jgi:transposase-like protein